MNNYLPIFTHIYPYLMDIFMKLGILPFFMTNMMEIQ